MRNPIRQPLPAGLYLFANKRTMSGKDASARPGEFPRYVYWEEPDTPTDSGWRVFVGDETQEDADDPVQFQVNAVETLTKYHPQLLQVIAVGVTGAWAWDDDQELYVQLEH